MIKLPLTVSEREAEQGKRKLRKFVELAWPIVEPDQPFVNSWHIDLLCEHYEACLRGEIPRLVVNLPPGMSKSRLTCVFFPTWAWLQNPGLRFMHASFDIELTMRDAGDALGLMQSDWFRNRWGEKFILPKNSPVGNIKNSVDGWRFACSVGGKATGRHANIQLIDDPTKPKGMTKENLEETRRWLQNTMASRWRKPGVNSRILIMQRLHVDDLARTMLDEGAVHVNLPMEFKPQLRCQTKWGKDERTEPGELLCPERFDEAAVATLKREMGGLVASAQLDQDPVPEGGAIFKLDWFKHYKIAPEKFDETIQSWDCTFKGADDSDFVVGQVWGRKGGEYWLLDQVKGRWTFSQTLAEIRKLSRKWPKVTTKLIEDKANGSAVIDTLQKELSGILPINPEGGKEARANAVSPLFEAGNVYIPEPTAQSWIDDYTTELCKFPLATNDDQVDGTTQALLHLHKRRSYLSEAMKKAFST